MGKISEEGQAAMDQVYPIPDSPHASVIDRANNNRIAFQRGWEECMNRLKEKSP